MKGNAELAQSTEAKADEYIRKGYELGIIKAETRLTLKDELYNRAVILSRGQRTIKERRLDSLGDECVCLGRTGGYIDAGECMG